jgi:predicted anti-sigma-YlaC factor YlaD
MRCNKARAKLQALLDGALRPNDEARVHEHLAACEPCRRHLASLRLLDEALSTQPEAEPSPDLAPAIMAQAHAQGHPRPQLVPVWLEAWTLASVALGLAACGLALWRHLPAAGLPHELAGQLVGLLPATLAAAFGLFGLWYYRP